MQDDDEVEKFNRRADQVKMNFVYCRIYMNDPGCADHTRAESGPGCGDHSCHELGCGDCMYWDEESDCDSEISSLRVCR